MIGVRRADGSPYEWTAKEQIHPRTRPLRETLDSRGYREIVKAGLKGAAFTIDGAEFERRSPEIPDFCGGL